MSLSRPRVGALLMEQSDYARGYLQTFTGFPRRHRPCYKHGVLGEVARLDTRHSLGRPDNESALDLY